MDDVTVYACLQTAKATISISDVSITEGNSGTTNATFTVSLSHASTKTITMKAKVDGDTAKRNEDFTRIDDKTITIPPLALSATVVVEIKGDTQVEPDETFFVNLSKSRNATIADGQGVCTILSDD